MALIVEDGTGYTDADSYCSVVAANAHHKARGNVAWEDVDNVDKESALRKATDYLDQFYGSFWRGDEYAEGQALDWPRMNVERPTRTTWYGVYSTATYYVPTSPLPRELVKATAEAALKVSTGVELTPDIVGPAVKQETVGPLTVVYQDGEKVTREYPTFDNLLAPLLRFSNTVRLVRT